MIVNNQNQMWETHEVALCHVWNCDRLLRLDQAHTYVKPEWFGSPWAHGLDVVAICAHHIIGKDERIEVLSNKPLFSPESLQELANILGDDGAVFTGNTPSGTWSPVEPELETFDHANQIDKLDAIAEFQEPRVQDNGELKDFVFKHEVIDANDFLYQEWLMDINEGSPHRHIGGAL